MCTLYVCFVWADNMVAVNQFFLLLWKNFTVSRRNYCATVFEIALPIAFAVLLLALRFLVKSTDHTQPSTWGQFTALDSFYTSKSTRILYSPDHASVVDVMSRVQDFVGHKNNITGKTDSGELHTIYLLGYPQGCSLSLNDTATIFLL